MGRDHADMGHPTGKQDRVEALARGCGITVLVAGGVVCAVVLGMLWWIHRAWSHPPPDVGAFAHSAATRAADASAARTSSARLEELASALPWAVPLGTSVADSCSTRNQNSFIGPRNWAPISCARSSVLYVAFDGDIRVRLHQLDAVLAGRQWVGSGGSASTLTGMATWMGQAGGDPSPAASQQGSTESPGPRPICLSTTYRPASQRLMFAHGSPHVSLRAAVAERPCPPEADTGDVQIGSAPRKSAVDRNV
jgi:hypothetical protein